MREAAIDVQRVLRGYVGRRIAREALLMRGAESAAASVVGSAWKGYVARREAVARWARAGGGATTASLRQRGRYANALLDIQPRRRYGLIGWIQRQKSVGNRGGMAGRRGAAGGGFMQRMVRRVHMPCHSVS